MQGQSNPGQENPEIAPTWRYSVGSGLKCSPLLASRGDGNLASRGRDPLNPWSFLDSSGFEVNTSTTLSRKLRNVGTIVAIDDKDVLYGTLHYAKLTHPDMQPGEFGQAPLEHLVPVN
jgi:hypothetical protein